MSVQERALLFDADSIVNTVRQPLLVLSADLRVQMANADFYRTFGVEPKETIGRLIYDLGNQHWRIPALQELLEKLLLRNREVDDFEIYHEFPHLGRKVMLFNGRRISGGDGRGEYILLSVEDITDRQWIRYFDLSTDLLAVATLDGFFVEVNPSFTRVLGYTRDDLLSKPFRDFIHPDDKEQTADVMLLLESGHDLTNFRNRYRCRDGSYRWLDWNCPCRSPEKGCYMQRHETSPTSYCSKRSGGA